MWKAGDQEIATPKRVRTYHSDTLLSSPKHSDTLLSSAWRINMANKKKSVLPSLLCEERLRIQVSQQHIVLPIISAFCAILEIILKAL